MLLNSFSPESPPHANGPRIFGTIDPSLGWGSDDLGNPCPHKLATAGAGKMETSVQQSQPPASGPVGVRYPLLHTVSNTYCPADHEAESTAW
jgi:hypothetical protein